MADVPGLLDAALKAYEAKAPDLAADFLERALRELRPPGMQSPTVLPWSSKATDPRRSEYLRRSISFLEAFDQAGNNGLAEIDARAVARRIFPEQPRMVGPTFYRTGCLEVLPNGNVRLTPVGRGRMNTDRRVLKQREAVEGLT